MRDGISFKGVFKFDVYSPGGIYLGTLHIPNTTMTAGRTDLLSVAFAAGTQKTAWYFGLIDATGYSAISAGDTSAAHAGWTESTAYAEATRQAWSPTAASSVATNATAPTITMNATTTVKGAFIISNSTKGGATGILWSAGLFSSGDQALVSGQVLRPTYSLTAA